MRVTSVAAAGLAASLLFTASPAHADPMSEVQELQSQVDDLHNSWDVLTPEQRKQRIAQLQRQVTIVDQETRDLPPEQQLPVEMSLLSTAIELADLLRMAQASQPQPCVLLYCPPPRAT